VVPKEKEVVPGVKAKPVVEEEEEDVEGWNAKPVEGADEESDELVVPKANPVDVEALKKSVEDLDVDSLKAEKAAAAPVGALSFASSSSDKPALGSSQARHFNTVSGLGVRQASQRHILGASVI
jgi:hypothetical protein